MSSSSASTSKSERTALLAAEARSAREDAYAPYSKFKVGAALLGVSGRVYRGANVENASYGLTICAERAAVAQAVSSGERKFTAIAVFAGGKPISPCGACRQVLLEFAPNLSVVMVSAGRTVTVPLSRLLPAAFSRSSL